jgi:hypothetical protein
MTGIFSVFWKMDVSVIRCKKEIFLLSCNRYTVTVLSSEPNAYNGLNWLITTETDPLFKIMVEKIIMMDNDQNNSNI